MGAPQGDSLVNPLWLFPRQERKLGDPEGDSWVFPRATVWWFPGSLFSRPQGDIVVVPRPIVSWLRGMIFSIFQGDILAFPAFPKAIVW